MSIFDIKAKYPKPTDLLFDMLVALQEQASRDEVIIDMAHWGEITKKNGKRYCLFCAATALFQHATGKNLCFWQCKRNSEHIKLFKLDPLDMYRLRLAINHARIGELVPLLCYYYGDEWRELKIPVELRYFPYLALRTDDWFNKMFDYSERLHKLREYGY